MVLRPTLRSALVTALLGAVVLVCLAHAGSRLSRWSDGDAWPAPLELPRYEWIGEHARDAGELGLELRGLALEQGSANALNLELFRVQHVIAPSVLMRTPRERSLLVLAPGHAAGSGGADLRRALRAEGFADAVARAAPSEPALALADRGGRLVPRPDARVRSVPTAIGALYLALVLCVPPLLAARRGWIPLGLALVGTPCALALAAALGDLVPAASGLSGAVTLLAHAALCAAGLRCVAPLGDGGRDDAGGGTGGALAVACAAALGLALFVLLAGSSPEGGWDAQAMYNARARFVLFADAFVAPFADAEGYRELHPDYPPLVPFAVAGAWRLGDGLWPLAPLLLQAELALGAAVLVVVWARRTGGTLAALTALALLGVAPLWLERVAAQECDVPLAALVAAGVVTWRLGQLAPSPARLRRGALVGGLCFGAAALVKNEGLVFAAAWTALLVLLALRRPRVPAGRPSGLGAYLAGLVPALLLLAAFRWIAPSNDLVRTFDPGRASWDRLETIARSVGPLLVRPQEFKSVFALVALPAAFALVAGARRWWSGRRDEVVFEGALATLVATVAAAFVAAYLVTPYDLGWHLRTSQTRLLAQLYPLAVVLGLSAASRGLRSAPRAQSFR